MSKTTDKRVCDSLNAGATLKRSCETSQDEPPRKVCKASHKALSQINDKSMTPLHIAAWSGCIEAVRELLATGADTRAQNSNGYTPLHTAMYFLEEKAADCLVDADNNISIPDKDGLSPLHVAAKYGYAKIVSKLLAGGVNASPQDAKGKTPLHYATEREFNGIVNELLFNDAHPHTASNRGHYPLEFPVAFKYYKIVQSILSICALKDIVIDWKDFEFKPKKMQFCIEFVSKCYEESQRMKESEVYRCNFSLHNLASGHLRKVAKCLENQVVRDILYQDFREEFPLYAELIAYNVGRAEKRRVLVDQCLDCFYILSKKLPSLPRHLLTDMIFFHLTEQDLQNLIKAFK